MKDKCPLCKKAGEIRDSHLLPASAYKAARSGCSPPDDNPVVLPSGSDSALYSSKEIKSLFLCDTCEQRISARAENDVMPQCFRNGGEFAIRDKLRNSKATFERKGRKFYLPDDSIKMSESVFKYFIASIFWKGSAGNFNCGYENSLGRKYTEAFRLYLDDKAEGIENAYFFVQVDNNENIIPFVKFPYSFRHTDNCYYHIFVIQGMIFKMVLGKEASKTVFAQEFKKFETQVIFSLGDFDDFGVYDNMKREVNKRVPKGKLAKE